MKEFKLNTGQIDQLYNFTRQHFVEYYDLQTELVDHLANGIETELEQNPKLTFEQALNIEFKKFGIFGFMDVVEERQKFLGKKYTRLIWNYYKEFFRLPKILLTLALVYVLFLASKLFQNPEYFFFGILIIGIAIIGFEFVKKNKEFKRRQQETGKKWLFEEVAKNSNNYPFVFLPVNVFNIVNAFSNGKPWTDIHSILTALLFVLLGLWLFVQLKIVPKKVSEELEKTYPEYQISK